MSFYSRWTTSAKVRWGLATALVIAVAVGLIGFVAIDRLGAHVRDLGEVRMPSVQALLQARAAQHQAAYGERGLINRRMMEAQLRAQQYAYVAEGLAEAEKELAAYAKLPQDEREAAAWREYERLWLSWRAAVEAIVAVSREKDALVAQGVELDDPRMAAMDAGAFAHDTEARQILQQADAALQALVASYAEAGAAALAQAARDAERSRAGMGLALLFGVLLLGGVAWLLSRSIARGLRALDAEMRRLTRAGTEGRLSVRGDAAAVAPEFRSIVEGVNRTLDAVVTPLQLAAQYIDRIAKGETPPRITDEYKGDFNTIKNNLNTCIDEIHKLVDEMGVLVRAGREGRLGDRTDAEAMSGFWRKILRGVNETLDSITKPLNVAADYIDRIAKGNTPPKIVEEYKGDFAPIKDNLNHCIETISALVDEVGAIVRAGKEGQLASRANADRLAGVWRKILRGCNEALDAVITPLNVAAFNMDRIAKGDIPPKTTDEYKGDFNTIKNNLNTCIDAINALIADAGALADAAVAGQLDTRADASRHEGDYRKIINGMNRTLDAAVTPIQEAAKALERLANYDLRARMQGDYQGDHAKIKASLNQTAQALHDALAQVAEAVDQVSSASQQIAASSQQVAEGSSEQASSLEETSSSLEEMASMTKQNADSTQQAKALTDATRGAADRGTASMAQMIDAMGKIRTASEGTAQIIRDINEIAFQTNLLALNAAVEAARAGDAGRGFAVVAEEVRNLAQRAKEAAKKTEDLINESVTLAESGGQISQEVSGNLTEILTSASKVAEIVAEVATASQEQSRGIEQVNAAVAEMDKVVQAAAASAEESSSASQELAGQSQELAAMVGRFQLQGQEKRPATGAGAQRNASAARPPSGRPSPPAGRRPAPGKPSARQPKPEDVIPLEDELTLSRF